MKPPRRVSDIEVRPRGGFEMEKEFIPAADKIKVVNLLAEVR